MDSRSVGLLIIVAGVSAVLVGLAAYLGLLGWFGRLPGDIRYERENVRIYAPIVSMLLLSVVLSVLIAVIWRFF